MKGCPALVFPQGCHEAGYSALLLLQISKNDKGSSFIQAAIMHAHAKSLCSFLLGSLIHAVMIMLVTSMSTLTSGSGPALF